MAVSLEFHDYSYQDGDKYKGQWSQGDLKRHGMGLLTFADGTVYAGQFAEGFFSGLGVLTFPDKSKYEGQFKEGKYNGFGVFTKSDGVKFEGEFSDGKIQGAGKFTFANGTSGKPRQEGIFQDKNCVQRGAQPSAVKQAQDVRQEAFTIARKATDLKG
eukprot:m.220863 g.220863  ORF g.220863 m.220863 type:complete len:158 (+) comp10471_c0_seq1:47-520(+)